MKSLFKIVCLILLFSDKIQAQIFFSSIPSDLQLIPRSADNTGFFNLSGRSTYPDYNRIRSKIIDNSTNSVVQDIITNIDALGNFSVSHQVTAALKEYNLQIFVKNETTEVLIKTVSNIVCGDVFIIDGQSNAQCAFNDDNPQEVRPGGTTQNLLYSNQFCRSIGTNIDEAVYRETTFSTLISADFKYARPSCIFWDDGFVGAWAIKFQNDLANKTGIPSCIVNGAKNGTEISLHYASHTPSNRNSLNLNTPYDRLFKKLDVNGLTNYVKGIFWYQGEADASLTLSNSCDYLNRFNKIYNSWEIDYPNVQKIFLFQMNTGCNENNSNESLIRDLQRRISDNHSNVIIMATVGSDDSDRSVDECHYVLGGYNKLADKITPPVEKYIYNLPLSDNDILPPKITRAFAYSTNQICLQFDKNVSIQNYAIVQGTTLYLKDYFYGDNYSSLNLSSVTSVNNNVYLNFPSGSVLPKKITYIPNNYSTVSLYVGPWIMNALNTIGALTFFDYPVTGPSANGWSKVWTNFGNNNIGGHTVNATDLFYTGDFDGGGDEELLCVQNKDGDNDWISMLKFNSTTNNWDWIWSNYGNPGLGNGIYNYRKCFVVGDYDGDGKDELLGNDVSAPNAYTTLFKFSNNNWHWSWSDYGSASHPMRLYKDKMYPGDFNGDSKDEILGCDLHADGWTAEFRWNGSDFVWGSWSDNGVQTHPIRQCRNNMIPADYHGNGKTDLLGFGSSGTLFTYANENWNSVWSSNETNSLGGWADPLVATDRIIAGNIDSDSKEELLFLQTQSSASWATAMDLKLTGDTYSWNWIWSANPIAPAVPYIDDWQLSSNGTTDVRYYLIKAKSTDPKYLLAMKNEGCGYLVNMYKANDLSNYNSQSNIPEIEQPFPSKDVVVFPNPTSGNLTVALQENSTITIFDNLGRIVYERTFENTSLAELSLAHLNQGIYLVKIATLKTNYVKKIVLH